MTTQLVEMEKGELGLAPLPMLLTTTPVVLKVWFLTHMHQKHTLGDSHVCKKLLCSQI